MIGLRNQLHKCIFNSIVNHLYIMSGRILAQISDTGFVRYFGGYGFKKITHPLVGFRVVPIGQQDTGVVEVLVEREGFLGLVAGAIQLAHLQVLGTVAEPTPLGVTGAQINAGDYQGMLVTVTGTIQSVDELSYGNQMVILQDGVGTDLRIYVDSRNGVRRVG